MSALSAIEQLELVFAAADRRATWRKCDTDFRSFLQTRKNVIHDSLSHSSFYLSREIFDVLAFASVDTREVRQVIEAVSGRLGHVGGQVAQLREVPS